MEAKLIKENNYYYYLKHDDKIIGTIDAHPLSSINVMKLSLKNCQAIERGYDLDVLAENKWNELSKQLGLSIQDKAMWCGGFKHGLLEILGDKKYGSFTTNYARDRFYNVLLPSLQQTEWDVEIVMDICGDKVYAVPEPATDEDGCLILKRI